MVPVLPKILNQPRSDRPFLLSELEPFFFIGWRMMFGLYYNTPLVAGCENSGLFQAFSQFFLHRLRVSSLRPTTNKLRCLPTCLADSE